MDEHDRDLLDKQTRHLGTPPTGVGTAILGVVAAFLAGLVLGGYTFTLGSEAAPPAVSPDFAALMTQPNPALPIAR
jgi:hypothetical protein